MINLCKFNTKNETNIIFLHLNDNNNHFIG